MKKSIKSQLLLWLLVPLLSLALLSTIIAHYIGAGIARSIYDKQLLNSADSVAARIRSRGEKLNVDLPPAALAILRLNYRDLFYYQVLAPDGTLIAGDKFLPEPESVSENEPLFRTTTLKSKELRIVTVYVPTPELPVDHVVIQAAETRKTRNEFAGQITMGIFVAQMILIVSGAIAIWLGVGRGLLPLARIEMIVQRRSPRDLSPLKVEEPIEIVSMIRALNRLLRQVADDVEAQKRFTSNAAHQLRTPLAVLGTYCDLAKRLVKDKEASEVLNELDAGISRMSKLVNRLLALAKSEPTVSSAQKQAVFDLSQAASVICASHVPDAIKRKVELEFMSAHSPALVLGDQSAIEELISNLVENSILYVHSPGNVSVQVQNFNGRATLQVQDDGPGIAPEERQLVFERFYRIPGTEQPGTGLGLSIVREIANSHDANVDIMSGPGGEGTIVRVSFPQQSTERTAQGTQCESTKFYQLSAQRS